MNWELQLAAAMTVEDRELLDCAKEALELSGRSRYGAALKILWRPLLVATRNDRHRHRAFLLIHMGKVYRNWMIDVAFKFFRDARDLCRSTAFERGEMVAESAIGELYLQWNEPARAIVNFRRSLTLAEECAGQWCQRDVLVQVVTCLESLGQFDEAVVLRRKLDRVDRELMAELWGEPEGRDRGLAVAR